MEKQREQCGDCIEPTHGSPLKSFFRNTEVGDGIFFSVLFGFSCGSNVECSLFIFYRMTILQQRWSIVTEDKSSHSK